ncbi:MAG: hypothetical protein LBB09_03570 [Rickettsiales bacterium]|jgi:cell shape-determining protein MreD|nr:hypothetical protein [Rickettsiales bacterium]
MCVLANKIPGAAFGLLNFFPNLDLLFLYYCFFLREKNSPYIYLHLFLWGLIMDAFGFLPLGLNGLSLLLTHRIAGCVNKVLFTKDSILCFMRDNSIFLTLFFLLKWFLFSIFRSDFAPPGDALFPLAKNIFYFNLGYFCYAKFRK